MNELDYDAMQKKRIARSAQHRVCGAKSRKCSLPSDNLTEAQKRALNGPVQSWNPTAPIDWDTFKSMPHDLQQAHLDYIQDRFGVGVSTVSMRVFRMGRMALTDYCHRRGLSYQTFRGTPSAEKLNRLEDWVEDREESCLAGLEPEKPIKDAPVNDKPVEDKPESAETPVPSTLLGGTYRMRGSANAVLQELWELLHGREIDLTVTYEIINKEETKHGI